MNKKIEYSKRNRLRKVKRTSKRIASEFLESEAGKTIVQQEQRAVYLLNRLSKLSLICLIELFLLVSSIGILIYLLTN